MTARGAANALTRATAILAAAFFATSLALSIMARYGERPTDILDRAPTTQGSGQNGEGTGSGGVLDQLGGTPTQTPAPAAPSGSDAAPAAPAPAQPATPQVPDQ